MKIVVTSGSFSKNTKLVEELKKISTDISFNLSGESYTRAELIEHIKDADAVVLSLDIIDEEILAQCKNLKIISKYGVGYDNIDVEACNKYNIKFGWTGGVNKTSVAEVTIAFMIALTRNLYASSNTIKNGSWKRIGGFDLRGKTVGLIGVGYIGKEVIRLLKPFGCNILVNDIIDQTQYYKDNGLIESSKEEIYKKSDIVSVHTPLIEETKDLINLEVFKMMKNTAYLINTARGKVVNQEDLKYALTNNLIAGAAIDVFYEEPPSDIEFLSLDNLICTPHIAGVSEESVEALGMSAISHLKEFFKA